MGAVREPVDLSELPFAPPELWRERVGGNQSVRLDGKDAVWLVSRGGVDVFGVLPEADERDGARRFLFRVDAGDVVFGMTPAERDGAIGLIAVPSAEGELVRLDDAVFEARDDPSFHEAAGRAVDRWATALAKAVAAELPPREAVHARVGRQVSLQAGGAVVAPDGVAWIEGSEALSVEGRLPLVGCAEGGRVPVTAKIWFEATADLEMVPRSAADVVRDGGLFRGLRAYHAALLGRLYAREADWARDERERLAYASAAAANRLDRSLRHLDGVLEKDALDVSFASGELRGLPLVAAFETVARAGKVEFSEVREPRVIASHRDPVAALARGARVGIRRVELVDAWWTEDGGPMLGFLEDGHRPVALLPTSTHAYEVFDPTDGSRRPLDEDVAQEISSSAYVLYRSFPARVVKTMDLLRIGMAGSGADLFVAIAAGFFAGLLALFVPLATSVVLDDVIPNAERSQLFQYTLLLIASAVAITMFSYSELISLLRIRGKMDNRLQSAVWERLLALPVSFFRRFNAGDLALRAMGINSIASTLATATLHSVFSGVFSIFSLGLMVYYSWKLAIVGVILVFVATGIGLLIIRLQLRYQRPLQMQTGAIAGQVLQIVGGIAKLRVAGAEARAFAAWADSFAEQKLLSLKARSRANAFTVFSRSFMLFSTAIILVGISYFAEGMEVGSFAAFHTAYAQFAGGAMGLLMAVNSTISVIPLYERAQPILETIPEVVPQAGDPGELRGRIELDQVCFRYERTAELILNHVTLAVEEGEFLAVVGPSGAGKSTLFRLLLGFETPESGTISFDRRNIAGLDLGALRRQIGVVLQDGKLMPGSIFENIVGSSILSEEDAWEAARLAGLEPFIKKLPMGMHTFVSEGAATFSGGQRQRLMIARAIVKKPRVLLFDEATSALDNQTQSVVSDAVDQLNATRVVIAHRLSTVVKADRIVVLEHGRLVQSGTYDELLHQEGPFAELAKRQIA